MKKNLIAYAVICFLAAGTVSAGAVASSDGGAGSGISEETDSETEVGEEKTGEENESVKSEEGSGAGESGESNTEEEEESADSESEETENTNTSEASGESGTSESRQQVIACRKNSSVYGQALEVTKSVNEASVLKTGTGSNRDEISAVSYNTASASEEFYETLISTVSDNLSLGNLKKSQSVAYAATARAQGTGKTAGAVLSELGGETWENVSWREKTGTFYINEVTENTLKNAAREIAKDIGKPETKNYSLYGIGADITNEKDGTYKVFVVLILTD